MSTGGGSSDEPTALPSTFRFISSVKKNPGHGCLTAEALTSGLCCISLARSDYSSYVEVVRGRWHQQAVCQQL